MIRVQNVYYMLAYAFQVLQRRGYRDVATEKFENAADLCAEILIRGIESQLKRGLGRTYVTRTEPLSSLRGKIEVSESVKTRTLLRRQLVCTHDEFSVDTTKNQVIKATAHLLLRADIDRARKKALKRLMAYFSDVSDVDLAQVDWHMRFDRNSQTYRMLMGVCWLVCKGLLQMQEDGSSRLMDFFDEQRMSRLYERFILEYYRREHPDLEVGAPFIDWALDSEGDDLLPVMRSDVTLARGDRTLIIDAKYYSHATQQRFGKRTIHSGNLYQIFAYVKNEGARWAGRPHEVSGMLLYAATDEDILPNSDYVMSGNRIGARTLDLGGEFVHIREQLDGIVDGWLGGACEKSLLSGRPMRLPSVFGTTPHFDWGSQAGLFA